MLEINFCERLKPSISKVKLTSSKMKITHFDFSCLLNLKYNKKTKMGNKGENKDIKYSNFKNIHFAQK